MLHMIICVLARKARSQQIQKSPTPIHTYTAIVRLGSNSDPFIRSNSSNRRKKANNQTYTVYIQTLLPLC